jgi:hypothetical protein
LYCNGPARNESPYSSVRFAAPINVSLAQVSPALPVST